MFQLILKIASHLYSQCNVYSKPTFINAITTKASPYYIKEYRLFYNKSEAYIKPAFIGSFTIKKRSSFNNQTSKVGNSNTSGLYTAMEELQDTSDNIASRRAGDTILSDFDILEKQGRYTWKTQNTTQKGTKDGL